MQNLRKVQNCAEALKHLLPQGFTPAVGIVLGTGLGDLALSLEDAALVSYGDLPGFPESTVESHHGSFVAGALAGVPVLLQRGRCHLYEGRSPADVCTGVRVMAALGTRMQIITNSAGAINPRFDAGSLMLIEDQINMTGKSPLTGNNVHDWGPRFPDMSRLYDPALQDIAAACALGLGMRLERGVYLCIPGPQLETRAETRAFRQLGADAVGMSTVLEAIAARHMGQRVLGISSLTNKNLPDCMAETSIEEIVESAQSTGEQLHALLKAMLPALAAACAPGA